MRVFVLGAGASYHAGYPLAADLGRRLAGWITTLPSGHDYRIYLKQVAELYGTLDNFEGILGDLMTRRQGSRAMAVPAGFLPPLLSNLTPFGIISIRSAADQPPFMTNLRESFVPATR